jgi:hypothetical protein
MQEDVYIEVRDLAEALLDVKDMGREKQSKPTLMNGGAPISATLKKVKSFTLAKRKGMSSDDLLKQAKAEEAGTAKAAAAAAMKASSKKTKASTKKKKDQAKSSMGELGSLPQVHPNNGEHPSMVEGGGVTGVLQIGEEVAPLSSPSSKLTLKERITMAKAKKQQDASRTRLDPPTSQSQPPGAGAERDGGGSKTASSPKSLKERIAAEKSQQEESEADSGKGVVAPPTPKQRPAPKSPKNAALSLKETVRPPPSDSRIRLDKYGLLSIFTPDELGRVMVELLSEVAALHQKGIVHGDIKPDNVRIMPKSKGHRSFAAPVVRVVIFSCP